VWQGGISLLGGFFGAILLALPEIRRRGISFWKQMDASAPGMALGVVIGRVGDLIVGDHLGKVTSLPFGYRCPPSHVDTASPCLPGTVVHQTALYDLVLTVVLLAVLLLLRRRPRYDGFLIILFAFWYGLQRIGEDFLREDVRHFGLTGSQITSLVTVAVCGAWLLLRRRTPRWGRWDEREAEPEPEPAAVTEAGAATAAVATAPPPPAPPEPPSPPPEPPPPPAESPPPAEPASEGDREGESGPEPPTMTTPPEDRREE
jgi:phosphatidylglycerol:prolipoprotein diacylglycerol transferase